MRAANQRLMMLCGAAASSFAWHAPPATPQLRCPHAVCTALRPESPYAILGVSSTATESEVRTAFRRRVRREHPDVSSAPDAAARFQRIVQAYELLTSGRAVAFQPRTSPEDIAQRLRRERQAAAARAAAAEKVEAQRRVSMLVTAAYIAGQYVIWFAFLKAASN